MLKRTATTALVLFLAACGGENVVEPDGDAPLAAVDVLPEADTLSALGETLRLTAIARDARGDEMSGVTFTWQSSDPAVATVDDAGRVTAVGGGTARITASVGQVTGEAALAVLQQVTQLAFLAGPASQIAGKSLDTIDVAVQDRFGNTVPDATDPVTLALEAGPDDASLEGTTTVEPEDGVARFTDLVLERAGDYRLGATTGELEPVPSEEFAIVPAAPAQLALLAEPGTGEGQEPLTPALEVAVQDTFGNRVTDATLDVTVSLAVNPVDATLDGTTTRTTVNGVATFDDLSVALPGDGFVLKAGADALTPTTTPPFSVRLTFVQLSTGYDHTCGLTFPGHAYCWGDNSFAALGDGTTADRESPTPVAGGLRFAHINAGGHTCGLTNDGVAYCWGDNSVGQLGDGTTTQRAVPTAVVGGFQFAEIDVDIAHTCGITTDNTVYCWGDNFFGQLGDGTTTNRSKPIPVVGGLSFAQISPGFDHTCGITTDNDLYCWGDNSSDQLGDGTGTQRTKPTPVSGDRSFTEVSSGGLHTCATTTDDALYCWGQNNSGQLGDGTVVDRPTPTLVVGGLSFADVTSAFAHTCGLTTDEVAYCWGENDNGQVGDGTTTQREKPIPVVGGLSFTEIDAGRDHTCGLATDKLLYCWGDNATGQLGDGTTVDSFTPTEVVQ